MLRPLCASRTPSEGAFLFAAHTSRRRFNAHHGGGAGSTRREGRQVSAAIAEPVAEPVVTPAPVTSPEPKDGPQGNDEPTYTKAQMEAIVKDRLDRANAKAAADREKAERDAQESALAEQQQYRELADQRAERIVELETEREQADALKADRDRYAAALAAYVDAEKAGAPDYVIEAIADRDPVAQLEYLTKNREKWNAKPGPRGIPETPRPANGADLMGPEADAARAGMGGLVRTAF